MNLEFISRLIEPTFQCDARALLNVVRRLVSTRVQIRRARKRDVGAESEPTRTELSRRICRGSTDVGTNARDIVMPEALPDRLEVRQPLTRTLGAARGHLPCGPFSIVRGAIVAAH